TLALLGLVVALGRRRQLAIPGRDHVQGALRRAGHQLDCLCLLDVLRDVARRDRLLGRGRAGHTDRDQGSKCGTASCGKRASHRNLLSPAGPRSLPAPGPPELLGATLRLPARNEKSVRNDSSLPFLDTEPPP